MNVQVTDRTEINAVLCGEIEGTAYADGEVWANGTCLALWRIAQQRAALAPSHAEIPTLTQVVTP
jgi:hypothetical protein